MKYFLIFLLYAFLLDSPAFTQTETCLSIDCPPSSSVGGLTSAQLENILKNGFSGFGGNGACGSLGLCEDGQDLEECYAGCNTIHDLLLDRCRAMRNTHSPSDRQACWAEAYDTLDTCRRRCEGR